jgi:hypothetical protein
MQCFMLEQRKSDYNKLIVNKTTTDNINVPGDWNSLRQVKALPQACYMLCCICRDCFVHTLAMTGVSLTSHIVFEIFLLVLNTFITNVMSEICFDKKK